MLTRIRAIVWKLSLDRISQWPHRVDAEPAAAIAVWAYTAAWLLRGEPFEILNAELDTALAGYPEPEYADDWG